MSSVSVRSALISALEADLVGPIYRDAAASPRDDLVEETDRAVLDACGWTNIEVPPDCPLGDDDKKQLARFEDEVIDRLFAPNRPARRGGAAEGGRGGRQFGSWPRTTSEARRPAQRRRQRG